MMSMNEFFISVLSSGVCSAIFGGIFLLLQTKQKHKYETKELDKRVSAEKIEELMHSIEKMHRGNRAILRDRLKFLARAYIANGSIAFDEKHDIDEMYHAYRDLGGNGALTAMMEQVDRLTVR